MKNNFQLQTSSTLGTSNFLYSISAAVYFLYSKLLKKLLTLYPQLFLISKTKFLTFC